MENIKNDLLAFFNLTETTGDFIDSHGDGTHDSDDYSVSDRGSDGAVFDAEVGDYIHIPGYVNPIRQVTVQAWFELTGNLANWPRIVARSMGTSSWHGFIELLINSNNDTIQASTRISGSGGSFSATSNEVSLNTFYHLIYRFDGTNEEIWLNGVRIGQRERIGEINGSTTAYPFLIGRNPASGDYPARHFTGRQKCVGFWDRAISDEEITALYNDGTPLLYEEMDIEEGDSYKAQTFRTVKVLQPYLAQTFRTVKVLQPYLAQTFRTVKVLQPYLAQTVRNITDDTETIPTGATIFGFEWENVYTQEVHDYYDSIFNNADDYTYKIYIDPDYTGGNSDGSIESPYTNIKDAPVNQNDTAFLVKRGTSQAIESSDLSVTGSNVMVGAYGEGDMPDLSLDRIVEFKSPDFLVRDVKVASILIGTYGAPNANNGVVFNCESRGITIWSRNPTIIGCHFGPASRNILFHQMREQVMAEGPHHVEIGYCLFEKANQVWLPDGKPQTDASGDGIQFSTFAGTYRIHNTIVDRSDTGNKFCIIVNPHTNGDRPASGIIENCYLKGPRMHPDGGAGIYLGNVVVNNGSPTERHEITIRNNLLQGTYCDIADVWTGGAIYANSAYMEVYGNLIKNFGYGARTGSSQSIVYNNTFVNMKNTGTGILTLPTEKLHNNIFDRQHHTSSTDSANNIYLDQVGTEHDDIFINPGIEDFKLKDGSPAINAGEWQVWMESEWSNDLLGTSIPHNNTIDVGAVQYEDTDIVQYISQTKRKVENITTYIGQTNRVLKTLQQYIGQTNRILGILQQYVGQTSRIIETIQQYAGQTSRVLKTPQQYISQTSKVVTRLVDYVASTIREITKNIVFNNYQTVRNILKITKFTAQTARTIQLKVLFIKLKAIFTMENTSTGQILEIQGDSWIFNQHIINKATGEPADCSGLHSLMVVKYTRNINSPVIAESYIDWTDQPQGKGTYEFLPETTKDIKEGVYHYQCYLFNNDYTFARTVKVGELKVLSTLKAPLSYDEE